MRCVFDLFYRVGGEDRTLSCNTENDDLTLSVRDEAGRRTVTLRAKRDIALGSYRETEHDLPGATGNLLDYALLCHQSFQHPLIRHMVLHMGNKQYYYHE